MSQPGNYWLTSAIQAEKLSWKTTTKFMERLGCVEYIFVKPGWNAIAVRADIKKYQHTSNLWP
jgi:hypothetical protein